MGSFQAINSPHRFRRHPHLRRAAVLQRPRNHDPAGRSGRDASGRHYPEQQLTTSASVRWSTATSTQCSYRRRATHSESGNSPSTASAMYEFYQGTRTGLHAVIWQRFETSTPTDRCEPGNHRPETTLVAPCDSARRKRDTRHLWRSRLASDTDWYTFRPLKWTSLDSASNGRSELVERPTGNFQFGRRPMKLLSQPALGVT